MLIGMDDIGMIAEQGENFATSTRTSPHRSAPTERVEVITRGARRRWSAEQKQSIVLESLAPDAVISEICRRHEISSGQFCTWRRQLRDREYAKTFGNHARRQPIRPALHQHPEQGKPVLVRKCAQGINDWLAAPFGHKLSVKDSTSIVKIATRLMRWPNKRLIFRLNDVRKKSVDMRN